MLASSPWVIGAAVIIGSYLAGTLLMRLLRPLLARAAKRSKRTWDDQLVDLMSRPVALLLALQCTRVVAPWLALDARAQQVLETAVALGTTATALWLLFRAIDLV